MRGQAWMRFGAVTLAFVTAVAGVTRPAQAMMISAEVADKVAVMDRSHDLKNIEKVLENKKVRQRLADYGLTDEQINQRLTRLSDAQVHQVALQIEKQNPAGDDNDLWLGLAVGVLLVALIVWIVRALR